MACRFLNDASRSVASSRRQSWHSTSACLSALPALSGSLPLMGAAGKCPRVAPCDEAAAEIALQRALRVLGDSAQSVAAGSEIDPFRPSSSRDCATTEGREAKLIAAPQVARRAAPAPTSCDWLAGTSICRSSGSRAARIQIHIQHSPCVRDVHTSSMVRTKNMSASKVHQAINCQYASSAAQTRTAYVVRVGMMKRIIGRRVCRIVHINRRLFAARISGEPSILLTHA